MAKARQKGSARGRGGRQTQPPRPPPEPQTRKQSSGSSPLSSAAASPPPVLDDVASIDTSNVEVEIPLPAQGNPLALIEHAAPPAPAAAEAASLTLDESDMAALSAIIAGSQEAGLGGPEAGAAMALDAGGDVDMGASDAKQTEGGDGPGTAADTADEEDADATDDATADEEDGDAETTDADDDEDDAADATIDEELAEAILAGEVDMADANDDGDDTDSDASSHGPASKRNNGPSSSMEYHYPAPIDNYADVPTREKQFRAGRFLPCQVAGCTCTGMEPPHGAIIHISVGEPMDPAVVKASKNMTAEGWWRTCGICGHGWEGTGHVFPDRVDGSERERRGRVMSRIEEMLAEEELLENFPAPKLQACESLYKQLQPFQRQTGGKRPAAPLPPAIDITTPGSGIMDLDDDLNLSGDEIDVDGERPPKRRRTSKSLEGSPLAQTSTVADGTLAHGKKPGKTSGKDRMPRTVVRGARGLVAMETEADGTQHPGGHLPDSAARAEGEAGAEDEDEDVPLAAQRPQLEEGERKRREMIKEKEREREEKLLRNKELGEEEGEVDVWEGVKLTKLPPRPAAIEEAAREIVLMVVGSRNPTPVATILLIGLKNLFQKQLPKMPREYITRLVLDKNHIGMAIVKRGWKVVGGICYRPFESRGFAEIVFCAVDSSEQIKGYGSHLMNSLKDHVRKAHPTINFFLTYADNYAVGYFKKQGFTKEISLPREKWVGYIKDYEGGTIMQCKMLPKVKYSEVHQMLADQKAAVLAKIKSMTRGHIVYPGLEVFQNKKPEDEMTLSKQDVPGLRETGWDPAVDALLRQPRRNPYHGVLQLILDDLQNDKSAWPFIKPVDTSVVQDYDQIIDHPMDFSTMETKLENNHYENVDSFLLDCQLIFSNCRKYNGENDNQYSKAANKLEKSLDKILRKRMANAPI